MKDRSTHEGGKSSQRTAPVSGGETRDAYSRGLGESRRERPEQHMPSDDDDDDDDDDEEVAFGQVCIGHSIGMYLKCFQFPCATTCGTRGHPKMEYDIGHDYSKFVQ